MADKEIMDQLNIIVDMMGNMATKDDVKALEDRMDRRMGSLEGRMGSIESDMVQVKNRIESLEESVVSKILTDDDIEMISDRAANKAAAIIENTLGRRIDALSDGYKITHEKQRELESRVDSLEKIVNI